MPRSRPLAMSKRLLGLSGARHVHLVAPLERFAALNGGGFLGSGRLQLSIELERRYERNASPIRPRPERTVIGAQKIQVRRGSGVLPACCRRPAHGRPCYQSACEGGFPRYRTTLVVPAAMRPKRSGRRPAGLRDPSTNSEVVAETGGDQTSRGPRLGCG